MDARCHSQNLTSAVALGSVGVSNLLIATLLMPSAAWLTVSLASAPLVLALQPLANRNLAPQRQVPHAVFWCHVAGAVGLAAAALGAAVLVFGGHFRDAFAVGIAINLGLGVERLRAGYQLEKNYRQRSEAIAHTVIGDSPWLR